MSAYATQLSELSKTNLLEETLRQHDKAAELVETLTALCAAVDGAIAYKDNPKIVEGTLTPAVAEARARLLSWK